MRTEQEIIDELEQIRLELNDMARDIVGLRRESLLWACQWIRRAQSDIDLAKRPEEWLKRYQVKKGDIYHAQQKNSDE